MNRPESTGWGHRLGGWGAIIAGLLRLSIVAAFTLTGLGAAGDRAYGSFSGLTFIPASFLVLAAVGLYGTFPVW